jgi:hypothetical protein
VGWLLRGWRFVSKLEFIQLCQYLEIDEKMKTINMPKGIQRKKIFVVLAVSLLLTVSYLGLIPMVKALDLPSVYDVTYTYAQLSGGDQVIFDYSTSPAPDNYDFNVTYDCRLWVLGSDGSGVIFYVWDNSDDATCFSAHYQNSSEDGVNIHTPLGMLVIGSDIPDAYVKIAKVDDDLTVYDSEGNLVDSGVISGTTTVGYAGVDTQLVDVESGSVTVKFYNQANPEPTLDTSPPSFGSITSNTTYAGNATQISCAITDDFDVSSWRCAWNNSGGAYTNSSAILVSGSSVTALFNGTFESNVGDKIGVQFWANDSSDNEAYSNVETFVLTGNIFPDYDYYGIGGSVQHALAWSTSSPPLIMEQLYLPSNCYNVTGMRVYMKAVSGTIDATAFIVNNIVNGYEVVANSSSISVGDSYSWIYFPLNYSTPNPISGYWSYGIFASGDFNFKWQSAGAFSVCWNNVQLTYGTLPTNLTDSVYSTSTDALITFYVDYMLAPASPPTPPPTATPPAGGGGGGFGNNPTPTPSSGTGGGGYGGVATLWQDFLAALSKIPSWVIWALIAILIIVGIAGVAKGSKKRGGTPSRSFNPQLGGL